MEKNNIIRIGNATTIINTIIVTVGGFVFGVLASYWTNIPFTEAQFISFLSGLVFFIFSYINAKYHNNYFDDEGTAYIPVPLNEQQTEAIQNFINETTGEDITIVSDDDYEC